MKVGASPDMYPGQTFAPMHFGARHLSHAGINELTSPAFDPFSKQPELKHAVVQVERASLPWQLLAVRCGSPGEPGQDEVLAWIDRLQPLLSRFAYAYVGLVGRDRPAVSIRIAHDQPIGAATLAEIDAVLDLPQAACVSYVDARRNISKQALLADGLLLGFRLSGDLSAGQWLRDVLLDAQPADTLRRWMLGPFTSPPLGAATRKRGRIVCNCLDVGEAEIGAKLAAGAGLEQLQAELRCGTSCGSCLPELRRMVRAVRQAA
jgi:assimilatory nitrate reductase catalytic subunit